MTQLSGNVRGRGFTCGQALRLQRSAISRLTDAPQWYTELVISAIQAIACYTKLCLYFAHIYQRLRKSSEIIGLLFPLIKSN